MTFPFWLSARVCGVALGGLPEAGMLLLFSFSLVDSVRLMLPAIGHQSGRSLSLGKITVQRLRETHLELSVDRKF